MEPALGFLPSKVLGRELPSKFPELQAQLVMRKGKGFKVDMSWDFKVSWTFKN